MTDHTDVTTNPRRRDLVDKLDRGDFDAAFDITNDPAADFDAFTASVWRQVANMFDLATP